MLKLLLDENVGRVAAEELQERGYDTISIARIDPGASDAIVLQRALREERILITLDRDFGRLIFLDSQKHVGVIYVRLARESALDILHAILGVLEGYGEKLKGRFAVVTETEVRIR